MSNKITVYKAHISTGKLGQRTINVGDDLPKGCYWTKEDALSAGYEIQKLRFAERERHKPAANEILDKLEYNIKELLADSNCELYFNFGGDSHGIYDESLEISTVVSGYEYTRKVDFN